MTLEHRLRVLAEALPSDTSSITLSRGDLLNMLSEPEAKDSFARDLTVEEVASEVRRAASTIRGWLIEGNLRGYKLNGRDWRVTRAALRAYLEAQGAESTTALTVETSPTDLGAWRHLREPTRRS